MYICTLIYIYIYIYITYIYIYFFLCIYRSEGVGPHVAYFVPGRVGCWVGLGKKILLVLVVPPL